MNFPVRFSSSYTKYTLHSLSSTILIFGFSIHQSQAHPLTHTLVLLLLDHTGGLELCHQSLRFDLSNFSAQSMWANDLSSGNMSEATSPLAQKVIIAGRGDLETGIFREDACYFPLTFKPILLPSSVEPTSSKPHLATTHTK